MISQGVGLALAAGVRPFLPPLLAGALASADAGVDFSGTDFAFLESLPFLAAMLALTALSVSAERRTGARQLALLTGALAVAVGALLFGGSLADEGRSAALGLVAGALAALLAFVATSTFVSRAKERLAGRGEAAAASLVTLYADGAALLLALLAVLVPPVSWLALALCAWLLLERRRRAGRKYEGLRVLR